MRQINNIKVQELKTFSNIRFKTDTAKRFQTFSRQSFKTHTEALQTMLNFFFYNEISPKEMLGPSGRTITNLIKKRFNAVVAIMKDMEKNGVMPTKAMLELLFEKSPQKRTGPAPNTIVRQRVDPLRDVFIKKVEAAIEMERENTDLKTELKKNRKEIMGLLEKIRLVKSSFGRPRLEVDMDHKDFEALKAKIIKG